MVQRIRKIHTARVREKYSGRYKIKTVERIREIQIEYEAEIIAQVAAEAGVAPRFPFPHL